MRAAKIFIVDLDELGLLEKVETLKVTLYVAAAVSPAGPTLLTPFLRSYYEDMDLWPRRAKAMPHPRR